MTRATGVAHPNIALVKYWEKRDERLILPVAGSLSLTLDAYPTTTTVELDETLDADTFTLNGAAGDETQTGRVTRFLDLVRELAETDTRAHVSSSSDVPTGAGLASSAAGFAALAVSAAAAFGLDLDAPALSRLARRGSGSASRSIVSGYAVWHAGDDEASFAEGVTGPDTRMVVVTVDRSTKAVSSREAMKRTALTSPYHDAWASSTAEILEVALEACRDDDYTRLGRITELHALRMHAHIQSADPPIRYLRAASIAVFDDVERLRAEGIECYATADAGPNVVVLTLPGDAAAVAERLAVHGTTTVVGPGPAASLVSAGAER
ncbi:diphosphomevalonate decarboxylase [Pseudoclavibacter chungangensis]|uniref:diphosphomevalonate decarboxylase n=1 Tax=Pseudoclavibacter chungangensis TaxID=587635 RepID=A0A7J5BUC3_9MICO|nr:diphosphomevalonate decarboxylase [Pseudoclavibacter chungangensis]KAB1657956.1 diphosphomevalonate decarboxylase [Pseudoclavibacter chungangensis]NYJ65890.1 diphosphomevalonate decarboxylase [Pseudoclavibacter chungangensis]